MESQVIEVKTKKEDGCLILLLKLMIIATIIYFGSRAITHWLPTIYDRYEDIIIKYFKSTWWVFLILFIICYSLSYYLSEYKRSLIDRFHPIIKMLMNFVIFLLLCTSILTATIFSSFVSFNVLGLGTFRHVTKFNKEVEKVELKENVNGKWVITIIKKFNGESTVESKQDVKKDLVIKKGITNNISNKVKSFIETEMKAAPDFVKATFNIIGVILTLLFGLLILIIIVFLVLSPFLFILVLNKIVFKSCRFAIDNLIDANR